MPEAHDIKDMAKLANIFECELLYTRKHVYYDYSISLHCKLRTSVTSCKTTNVLLAKVSLQAGDHSLLADISLNGSRRIGCFGSSIYRDRLWLTDDIIKQGQNNFTLTQPSEIYNTRKYKVDNYANLIGMTQLLDSYLTSMGVYRSFWCIPMLVT